jgi:hypothetical protein
MFRVVGGAVVYGLALYGVVKLFDRPKMAVVVQSAGTRDDRERSAAADVPDSRNDKGHVDQANETSNGTSATVDPV